MNSYLTVVELSSTKVTVVVGQNTDFEAKIVAHCIVPIRKGIRRGDVENQKKVVDALNIAIEKAESEVSCCIREITLCLWGQNIRNEKVKVSRERKRPDDSISSEEIKSLNNESLKFKVNSDERIMKSIPQSYDIDDRIGIAPDELEGMKGSKIDAYYEVIIGKESSIRNKYEVIKAAGLSVLHTIISPIGSAMATLKQNESENGVVLLDIGAGTTDIVIVKDHIVRFVACIPFAGQSVTDDIKTVACITAEMAELVKTKYGKCIADGVNDTMKLVIQGAGGIGNTDVELLKLVQVIEARMTEIFEAVKYVIEQSGFWNKIPAGFVITGGTCYMEYIRDLAKAVLEKNVRLGNASGNISDNSAESSFDANSSSAVGSLICGLNEIDVLYTTQQVPTVDLGSSQSTNIFGEELPKTEEAPVKSNSGSRLFGGKKESKQNKEKQNKSSISNVFGSLFDGQLNNNA